MKKSIVFALLVCMTLLASPAFAEHRSGNRSGQCPYGSQKDANPCPITAMLMKKSCFFLANADEIGLSEDQVKQIKAIKAEARKDAIRTEAGMQIVMIDMMAKLHESPVDVASLDQMIDDVSVGMAETGKKAVQSFADLKSVLTPEQMAKAKELWKGKA